MRRAAATVVCLLAMGGCADDRVVLSRGPLGPASYTVTFDVSGEVALAAETVSADLDVAPTDDGAVLRLAIADDEPIIAELRRTDDGRLSLETVQSVSPPSAGETDLAALVGQLDPPLADAPVRIGDEWASVRRIATGTVEAELRTQLRLVRFARVGGDDSAVLQGGVSGTLRTTTPSGTFTGRVSGSTEMAWVLDPGRLAASETTLRWNIEGAGEVEIRTRVAPG